jgi:alkylated DNA repair dioxygenase AlkB
MASSRVSSPRSFSPFTVLIDDIIDGKHGYLDMTTFDNETLLTECVIEIATELNIRPLVVIRHKELRQNRDVGFFSNVVSGYHYAGKIAESKPIGVSLGQLLDSVNLLYGIEFNGILINRYDNGESTIGAHCDDTSQLTNQSIVTLSYGADRIFRICERGVTSRLIDVKATSGSMLRMGGDFQKMYTHQIPQDKKIKNIRYSFTFRQHEIC